MSVAQKQILRAEDVAERWQCNLDEVYDAMFSELNALKFINLSRTPVKRHGKGPKKVRFRIQDVEAWESLNTQQFKTAADVERALSTAKLVELGHDGKNRAARKGKAGPRRTKA